MSLVLVGNLKVTRGTTAQRTAITPEAGALIFDTDLNKVFVGDGVTAGGLDVGAGGATVTALAIVSGVATLDLSLASDYFTLTLTQNATLAIVNPPLAGNGRCVALRILNNGGFTLTLPAAFKALGTSDTVVQSAAGSYTELVFDTVDGGTRYPYAMAGAAA